MRSLRQWVDDVDEAMLRAGLRTVGRWLFRDRQGLALWLGLLCWFGLTWRVGFFIQDTYAVANALAIVGVEAPESM